MKTILHLLGHFVFGCAVLVAFGLPFWWFCGAGRECPSNTLWVPALSGLVFVLVVTAIAVKTLGNGRRDERGDEARRRHDEFVAGHAAYLASLERHRHDPVLAKWIPRAAKRLVTTDEQFAAWEARYQELLSTPSRAWAVSRLLDGRDMTDLEIDYEADPSMRVTCVHLQPLEGALRDAGVPVRAAVPGRATAFATIDFARAKRRFALGPTVIEHVEPEHPHQAEERDVRCTACDSFVRSAYGPVFPPE